MSAVVQINLHLITAEVRTGAFIIDPCLAGKDFLSMDGRNLDLLRNHVQTGLEFCLDAINTQVIRGSVLAIALIAERPFLKLQ